MKMLTTRDIARKFRKDESEVVNDFETILKNLPSDHKSHGYTYTNTEKGYVLSEQPSMDLIYKYTSAIIDSAKLYFRGDVSDNITVSDLEKKFCMEKGFLFKWLEKENWLTKPDKNKMRNIGPTIKGFDLMVEHDFIHQRTGEHRRWVMFTKKGVETLKKQKPEFFNIPFSRM